MVPQTNMLNKSGNKDPLLKGESLIPGYTVIHHMRRGKDCDVYYVWSDERLTGCIAKTLQPEAVENELAHNRLIKEGECLTALSHHNLVRGYEIAATPIPVLIEETLTGETLSRLIRNLTNQNKCLSVKELAHLGVQLCSVIHYLHLNDLLHLDLKPSNIISQPPLVKVIDLNLAATPGEIKKGIGTKQYMAPEQARGEILTTAADVWGIGAVLFFAATGKRPFQSFEGERYEQLERPAARVQTYREMDESLATIIDRCLQQEVRQRPCVKEIYDRLHFFLEKNSTH
ncbi:serine/threonine-protein kinase [Gracilibacillus salinarum]|uniref:non-specific serine/threonine protein kinase n=1 Tax=Gracilibacillus salinarum TaxID=2932255 RepID=A0ABY4GSJ8_9BACI|nr:serine/threonine-protein kinase [Gracilibacillus salinarum]UOQ87123.1 serine/threonine protein kinase [Gracilibacillus salinarum]